MDTEEPHLLPKFFPYPCPDPVPNIPISVYLQRRAQLLKADEKANVVLKCDTISKAGPGFLWVLPGLKMPWAPLTEALRQGSEH